MQAAGMDAHLPKPLDLRRLVELVEIVAGKAVSLDRPKPAASAPRFSHSRSAPAPDADTAVHASGECAADVIDYHSALKRFGGDTALFRRIISLFDEDAPGLLQAIRDSVAANNAARLHRAAHSLRGLTANFDAQDAVAHVARLEGMGKSGRLEGAEQAITDLEREITRLDKALAPHRGRLAGEPVEPED